MFPGEIVLKMRLVLISTSSSGAERRSHLALPPSDLPEAPKLADPSRKRRLFSDELVVKVESLPRKSRDPPNFRIRVSKETKSDPKNSPPMLFGPTFEQKKRKASERRRENGSQGGQDNSPKVDHTAANPGKATAESPANEGSTFPTKAARWCLRNQGHQVRNRSLANIQTKPLSGERQQKNDEKFLSKATILPPLRKGNRSDEGTFELKLSSSKEKTRQLGSVRRRQNGHSESKEAFFEEKEASGPRTLTPTAFLLKRKSRNCQKCREENLKKSWDEAGELYSFLGSLESSYRKEPARRPSDSSEKLGLQDLDSLEQQFEKMFSMRELILTIKKEICEFESMVNRVRQLSPDSKIHSSFDRIRDLLRAMLKEAKLNFPFFKQAYYSSKETFKKRLSKHLLPGVKNERIEEFEESEVIRRVQVPSRPALTTPSSPRLTNRLRTDRKPARALRCCSQERILKPLYSHKEAERVIEMVKKPGKWPAQR